jgi:hypothetical protein
LERVGDFGLGVGVGFDGGNGTLFAYGLRGGLLFDVRDDGRE